MRYIGTCEGCRRTSSMLNYGTNERPRHLCDSCAADPRKVVRPQPDPRTEGGHGCVAMVIALVMALLFMAGYLVGRAS